MTILCFFLLKLLFGFVKLGTVVVLFDVELEVKAAIVVDEAIFFRWIGFLGNLFVISSQATVMGLPLDYHFINY